ncbi:MAG TPA: FAD-dependent oxidoreductase [Oleiagrimonas sp.]|nr:FAD-dependent oxidoreductase [Oleiagrimonas sp.]
MNIETPAVVVGAGVNGLGVARSLPRAKVPVWLLDTDMRRPEMHTRAARPLPISALHGDDLVKELVHLGVSRFTGLRPVLFLTQEASVATVSHHRKRLSSLYRFSLPPVDVVDALQHKQRFQCMAEKLGSPVSPLRHIRTPADLAGLEDLHYPVVIKPGRRCVQYDQQFRKAYRIASASEATDLVQRMLAVMPDIVVQEWIEGPDSAIHFCLQYRGPHGETVASFSGRKIRSWPPQVGGTASCTAAPEVHEELSALTTRFFRAAGVIGMASMEYKRDQHTGAWRMIEPTIGRTDYQEEVATLNGVNIAHAAWCSELGLPAPTSSANAHASVWRVRSEDMQSAARQGQRPGQGYPRGDRVVDALYRWHDPQPFLVQSLTRARRALDTRMSRLVGGWQANGGKS